MVNQTLSATYVRQNFFTLLDQISEGKITVTIPRKKHGNIILTNAAPKTADYQAALKKAQGIFTTEDEAMITKVRKESSLPRTGTRW